MLSATYTATANGGGAKDEAKLRWPRRPKTTGRIRGCFEQSPPGYEFRLEHRSRGG